MPGVDWIPGISHLKAGIQVVTGDTEGAKKTMENFHKECPVVSQVTSLVQLATGDVDGALDTQKRCLGTVNNVANGIPIVGHVKGVVHHAVGDHEGGNKALNAATRTTVVVASGAAAGLATGGIGAIPAGIAAGAGYDITATEITGKDQGCVAALRNAVENPSAGAIFDAVAIPVGDGLAGYSGGQVANKINTQIQVNGLEAARAAKMDQLNAGMEGGAGGGGGMTSGQAITLGKEINAMTAEINTLQTGTPQYWVDPKSGDVVVSGPSNTIAVPVPGCSDGNNEDNEKSQPSSTTTACQWPIYVPEQKSPDIVLQRRKGIESVLEHEDAIYYDSYDNESCDDIIVTKDNQQQKKAALKKHDEQKPEDEIDHEKIPFIQEEEIDKSLSSNNQQPSRNPNNNPVTDLEEDFDDLLDLSWLHLNLPQEFSYTARILLNSDAQGLYHSLIRHLDQWRDFIHFDRELINILSPIMTEITELMSVTASANTGVRDPETAKRQAKEARDKTRKAREKLRKALTSLSKDVAKNVKMALRKLQKLLYDFIKKNITINNYIGRTTNAEGHVQLHFKVKTLKGDTKVLVICVSDTLYKPIPGVDTRPIRNVVTVFFKPWWKDYVKHCIVETKEEMLKNKKK